MRAPETAFGRGNGPWWVRFLWALVAKVAHAGEEHGEAGLVGGGDHFLVADRAAGLDHGRGAGLDRGEEAVGEGEEGVRGDRGADRSRLGPSGLLGRVLRLPSRDPRGFE